MSKQKIHLVRTSGYTACGWEATKLKGVKHHDRVTCISCLKAAGALNPRRATDRAEARRGGTMTGLGILKCVLCGAPYAEHATIYGHR